MVNLAPGSRLGPSPWHVSYNNKHNVNPIWFGQITYAVQLLSEFSFGANSSNLKQLLEVSSNKIATIYSIVTPVPTYIIPHDINHVPMPHTIGNFWNALWVLLVDDPCRNSLRFSEDVDSPTQQSPKWHKSRLRNSQYGFQVTIHVCGNIRNYKTRHCRAECGVTALWPTSYFEYLLHNKRVISISSYNLSSFGSIGNVCCSVFFIMACLSR